MHFFEYIKFIIENTDLLTIAITIAIALVGWIFSLYLQGKNIKHQHKVKIRYDIYKQFTQLHKEIQDTLAKFAAKASPPFILMKSSMIPFELKLKKEYKGVWIEYSEQECVHDGGMKWSSFINDLVYERSTFNGHYVSMLYLFDDWASALQPLLKTKEFLVNEIANIEKEINTDISTLQMYTSSNGHDWRSWDQAEVTKINNRISENVHTIASYVSDFTVLIHNELISRYFGAKRPIRQTLDTKYSVLTKKGIIKNLNKKKLKEISSNKNKLITLVNKKLENSKLKNTQLDDEDSLNSITKENLCPKCRVLILVMDVVENDDELRFQFACGHEFKISKE